MKVFMNFSLLSSFLVFFLVQSGVSSCKKDTEIIVQGDTALTAQILTAHPWKVLEERGVAGGDLIYYWRGGSNNTQSFDNEYITFNSNNTGTLRDNNGGTHNFTWSFANTENTKLTWTVQNTPATYTITWENIRYKNGNLYHNQYFTDGNSGLHSHTQQIRMPK